MSVFKGENGIPRDDEAYDIWRKFVPAERILSSASDDNFWQMGDTGPCGRCSEIYYVRGTGTDPEIEIWNNVFMEFERSADGTLTPLPAPSIDTGMGLERITAVLQQKDSNYDTDLFMPLLTPRRRAGRRPLRRRSTETDVSMRVVADHSRATTFLIADGVIPSNEWRGYVLRKIMRRAMRHGKHLGLTEPFLHELVAVLAREMGDAYPELRTQPRDDREDDRSPRKNRFDAVLTDGLPRLEAEIAKALDTPGARCCPGDAAFRLYDTFGVPYDFIEDTAATHGVTRRPRRVRARDGRRSATRRARRARSAATERRGVRVRRRCARSTAAGDQFEGYTATTRDRRAGAGAVRRARGSRSTRSPPGERGFVALARTPFYLEAGGQVSDSGRIVNEATGGVGSRRRPGADSAGLPRAHRVRVERGALQVRDIVTAEVDADVRDATRRNHTATHLLHAALRQVLGTHVKQAGSLVAPDRLRFDFVHFQPVTRDELDRIERIVNEQIVRNTAVQTEVRSTAGSDRRRRDGAVRRKVRRPRPRRQRARVQRRAVRRHARARDRRHRARSSIVAESGVAAGVRRIEALTGLGAVGMGAAAARRAGARSSRRCT